MTTTTTAVVKGGTFSGEVAITKAIESARAVGHLIGPVTTGFTVPVGFEVSLNAVQVDPVNETYPVSGGGDGDGDGGGGKKRGLKKEVLDRIFQAYSGSWDMERSRRVDVGRDPNYCEYIAVGYYIGFDGREIEISARKATDLRPGSPAVTSMIEICANKIRGEQPRNAPPIPEATIQEMAQKRAAGQLRPMRLHIVSQTESKARARAIRAAFGVRGGFTPEELQKPFLVLRPQFTGRAADPQLQRELSLMAANAFFGTRRALYGGSPPPAAQLPPAPRMTVDVTPPTGEVPLDDGDDDIPVVEGELLPPEDPPAPPEPKRPIPVDTTKIQMPGKVKPGESPVMIADAKDKDLNWWANRVAQGLQDPNKNPNYVARDEAILNALDWELWKRAHPEDRG